MAGDTIQACNFCYITDRDVANYFCKLPKEPGTFIQRFKVFPISAKAVLDISSVSWCEYGGTMPVQVRRPLRIPASNESLNRRTRLTLLGAQRLKCGASLCGKADPLSKTSYSCSSSGNGKRYIYTMQRNQVYRV